MGRKSRPTDPAIGRRLREVRESVGLTASQFGALMDISQAQQTRYETGELSPDAVYLKTLAEKVAGVDILYLLAGVGVTAEPADVALTARARILLENYNAASDDTKRALEKLALLGAHDAATSEGSPVQAGTRRNSKKAA